MLKSFKLSDRMKNVAKISSGTFIGQVIQAASTPFIIRIFGSTNIGIATYLLAITPLINAISDLGCSNVIMIEDDDGKAAREYRVISTISLMICLISATLLTLYDYFFSMNLGGLNTAFLFFYLAADFFMSKQINICYNWLTKKKNYDALMLNPLIHYGAFSAIAIVLGLLGFKSYGYFIANTIGTFLSYYRMRRLLPRHTLSFCTEDYLLLFRERKNFIRYEMPANLLAQLKNQLPTLLIKGFFGNEVLGFYSACVKILNIPINLLANSMGRVFFQVASELKDNIKEVGTFTMRNIKKAMKFGIVPIILLISFGDVAVNLFYGRGFEMSGVMMRIIALQTYITFISLTVQGIATVTNRQKYLMNSLIFQTMFCAVSFVIGALRYNNIYIALILFAAFTVVTYTIYYCFLFHSIGIPWKKFAFDICIYYIIILISSFLLRYAFSFTPIYNIYI